MENDKTNDIIDVDVIKEEVIEEEKTEEAKEPEKKPTFKEEAIDFIKTFVICLGAVWLLTTFVFTPVWVDGMSMYPTLHDDDLGIASIFSAKYLEIERFDVVVVNDKAANSKDHWVKRVIGLPGETISCMDDVVYINGEGYGHCVGMSQVGANNLAKRGYDYVQILKHYYTNVDLKRIY